MCCRDDVSSFRFAFATPLNRLRHNPREARYLSIASQYLMVMCNVLPTIYHCTNAHRYNSAMLARTRKIHSVLLRKNRTTAHTANWEEAGTGHGWYGVSTVGWKVCACEAVCVCARGLVCYHCSAVEELSRVISHASRAVGRTDMYDFR